MRDEAMPAVDVVFGLAGTSLPSDHAEALARAVAQWLPWLDDEPAAGIHPLRTAPTTMTERRHTDGRKVVGSRAYRTCVPKR